MNSEHILWKEGDLDIITFGENLYYNHNESSGISEGNQYGNDISWMLRANPLVPIYNENGDYYMYDDLNKAVGSTTTLIRVTRSPQWSTPPVETTRAKTTD